MKYRLAKQEKWNLLKIVAIISVTICIINLVIVYAYPIARYDELINNAMESVNHNGLIKQAWRNFYGFVWQGYTDENLAVKFVKKEISISRIWGFLWLFSSLIFSWLVFDWYYAKYVVSGIIYTLLIILYMVIPVDIFPDFLPLAGQVDDVLIDIFGGGFGIASFVEAWKKRNVRKMLDQPQSSDAALNWICKEYGFEIKRISDTSGEVPNELGEET